jgi:hypothetical protein
VNIGDHLDEAADAIARATVALRDHRPHDPDEQAAVAVARTRLYEELERQVNLVDGSVADSDGPNVGLAASLREATAVVRIAMPAKLPDAPPAGPVSRAVMHAVDALVAVNTSLAGHLATSHGRPPTPAGIALRAGFGRADNLAATARLVSAALDLDTRLIVDGWLRLTPDAGSWRPLLMATGTDANRTEQGDLAIQALRVATSGNAAEAPSRGVTDAPIFGDQPWRWQLITSSRLLTDAMDAARASLITDSRNITVTEIARMAKSALTATHHIGHVLAHTTSVPERVTLLTRRAAMNWRVGNQAATLLRSSTGPPVGTNTADNALRAVADWLSRRIGPPSKWRPVADWPTLRPDQTWQTLVGEIAVRLPEIALLMYEQVVRAQGAGELFRVESFHRVPNKVIHLPQWGRAPADDPIYRQLRNSLNRAVDASDELADLTGVKRPVGIIDAVKTLQQRGEHATISEVVKGSFAAPPTPEQRPRYRPTPGVRWTERRDRHR